MMSSENRFTLFGIMLWRPVNYSAGVREDHCAVWNTAR